MAQNNCSTNENKHKKFVDYIFKICRKDCGIAAKLKRSGSENQAVSSWGILVQCGIDIENDNKRIPYSLVAEFIARSKLESDSGSDSFGRVLRLAISKKKSSVKDISDARIRRILNCDSIFELQIIVRSALNLIISRGLLDKMCFYEFLSDLISFEYDNSQMRIKKKWANDFYSETEKKEELENDE